MSARQLILMICLVCLVECPPLLQAGEDGGVARYVPWSGSFWPIGQGLLIQGPLTKYDHATGRRAAAWEYEKNPPGLEVPPWFGYCHAWASAAVMDREPIRLRSMWGMDGRPLYLGIGDQKGMLTACHTADVAQHYGVRYTGAAADDFQDIYPDQLWRVLKLYLQQQGIPLILDIEAGPEVWNYPVYAYRVAYRPTGPGNQYFGEMSLLMSDDAVTPDCLGVKVSKQSYYFTVGIQQGSVVLGTGRWIGPSLMNHPDFAWYPYAARSENPEVNYAAVKRLVDASGSASSARVPEVRPQSTRRPERVTSPGATPAAPWGRIAVPPNIVPGRSGGTDLPPNVTPELPIRMTDADARQPYVLSPVELLSLVTNQTSSFALDVTVDKFDGGHYAAGEKLTIRGTSAKAGYLYLFYLDSNARLTVMFPYGGIDNRIPAQQRFELPAVGSNTWRTSSVPGTHRVKAVVTRMPLIISGLRPADASAIGPREFLLPPSQLSMFQMTLGKHQQGQAIGGEELGGASPEQFVGEFAQDEVAFYVGSVSPVDDGHVP
jgi:hypothetical protein